MSENIRRARQEEAMQYAADAIKALAEAVRETPDEQVRLVCLQTIRDLCDRLTRPVVEINAEAAEQ